jgi:hypothetical protein
MEFGVAYTPQTTRPVLHVISLRLHQKTKVRSGPSGSAVIEALCGQRPDDVTEFYQFT